MIRQLILAYGSEIEHKRAVFAILSFWAWYDGDRAAVQTIVFTDCPASFTPHLAGLPVTYRLLTPTSLAQMRGAQNYIHRIKLSIISQVAHEQPSSALFFCDADTFFVAPAAPLLSHLRPGYSVMHLCEHSFEQAVTTWASFSPPQDEYPRKFLKLIKSRSFELLPGTSYSFSPSQMMWNSGVVGLAAETLPLLPAILALNDEFYAKSHWMVSEQAAFSVALPTQTQVLPSNQEVFHYWGKRQKAVMDRLLANLPALLASHELLPDRLARVRLLTRAWRQVVRKDEAQQAAKQAFSSGELLSGMKFTVKLLLNKHLA